MTNDLDSPETRYATSDGLSIAYQVFGSGTQDLVMIPPIVSHLDATWTIDLAYARMLRRLAQTFRVIVFDKRGQGLSDSFEGGNIELLDQTISASEDDEDGEMMREDNEEEQYEPPQVPRPDFNAL